ncbi:MAG: hypothetical protein JXR84_29020, partial [Anaerolineae bacterium]|nr:hypothetical protein [Anaerolineae bacterium]
WLVDWLFVRGVNLLYPHAFFYSIRGPRKDERPPDVGPNSPWWDDYKPFADYVRRMSWLNTDSASDTPEHVCHIAILTESIDLPWAAAKICFQHQHDFNYLELRHLWEDAEVTADGIHIAGMHYKAAILDGLTAIPEEAKPALQTLAGAGRLIQWGKNHASYQLAPQTSVKSAQSVEDFLAAIDRLIPPDLVATPPAPDLRYRHVIKEGSHYYILVNEGLTPLHTTLTISAEGRTTWIDPLELTETEAAEPLDLILEPYTLRILRITNSE